MTLAPQVTDGSAARDFVDSRAGGGLHAMSQKVRNEGAATAAVPLRKCQEDGSLYCRPKEIEEALAELARLPASELLERCRINDPEEPGYVPSECLLYFVRRPAFGSDEGLFREAFKLLRQRVLRAVPVPSHRIAGSQKQAESAAAQEIQEAVLHKFQEMLCCDRKQYDERLDFYEIRFNQALAMLRTTARRKVGRQELGREPLESGEDTNTPSAEVESALAALKKPGDGIDFLYRSKLHAAITSLPLEERRVIELILDEMPIDSEDGEVLTIRKVLKCSEKTVRNRRDRAFKKLRDALKEEEDA